MLTGCEFEMGFLQLPLEMAALVVLFSKIHNALTTKNTRRLY